MLENAVSQAANLETLLTLAAVSGQALRDAEAKERTSVKRRWEAQETAVLLGDDPLSWWVRGSVLRPNESEVATWVIEVSDNDVGPWIQVGVGARDSSGNSEFTWDIGAHAQVLQVDTTVGIIEARVMDATDEGPREVQVDELVQGWLPSSWHGIEESLLIWVGDVDVAGDGNVLPGAAQVHHVEDAGGYGFGTLITVDGDLEFDSCWDAHGDLLWRRGAGLDEIGRKSACVISE